MKIAFDFDGTIANTMLELEWLAIAILMEAGMSRTKAMQGYVATAGAPFSQQAKELDVELSDEQLAGFERQKHLLLEEIGPFVDVVPTLGVLRGQGHRIAIVSSTDHELIVKWLDSWLSVRQYVHEVYGMIEGSNKSLQVEAFEADYFVGDTDRDEQYATMGGAKFMPIQRDKRLCSHLMSHPNLYSLLMWSGN